MSYRLTRKLASDYAKELDARLLDLEQWRLPEMDQHGIDVQVLSSTCPGIQGIPDAATAKALNDKLADLVRSHPTRFAGFASLPMQDPGEAADELERTVRQLGFKGALVNGHTNGQYLEEQQFWAVFERTVALDVPIYLHPIDTPSDQMKLYGGYKEFPSQYIKDHMLVTTSGNFSDAALLCALLTLGADRMLFSVDYPYQRIQDGAQFIETAPISDGDKAKICCQNAEQLLKL